MMDRLLENDTILKILSVLVAIAVWVQVNMSLPQTVDRRITVPLAWTLAPHSRLVVLAIRPADVTIQIQGPTSAMGPNVTADAWVDLSKMTRPGTYSEPVVASVPTGTRLVAVTPGHVLVTVDTEVAKKFPVTLTTTGHPPAGYGVARASTSTATVTVSGPSRYVNQVAAVVGRVDVSHATGPFTAQVLLFPVNRKGQTVGHVELSQELVSADVQVTAERTLPVVVSYRGTPAPGYTVGAIDVKPTTVTVFGPQSALAGLDHVVTQPVDIAGATGSVTATVALVQPPGVVGLSTGSVTVTITIAP
jgi:YbbR domain-containing protein